MNGVTFNGRREVVYGLTKAASAAQEASRLNSISKGPRPINVSDKLSSQISEMKAYCDMITYDEEFLSTAIHGKILANKISKLLQSSIKKSSPFEYFSKMLYDAVSKNRPKSDLLVVNSFLDEIKLLLTK
ncbi:hypothetical protein IKQ21_03595 [bacterium]|nr:hypothetical protein [bacterium]